MIFRKIYSFISLIIFSSLSFSACLQDEVWNKANRKVDAYIIYDSIDSISLTEGGTDYSYTVVLSRQPDADVQISAVPDSQMLISGSNLPVSLTFSPENWDEPQSFSINALEDDIDEIDHEGVITHSVSSLDSYFDVISDKEAVVTISDNDTAGFTVNPGSVRVYEDGNNGSYDISLTSEPVDDVSITITPYSGSTVNSSSSPVTLTFTAADWSIAQTVTVSRPDDSNSDGNATGVTFSHSVSSNDDDYDGLSLIGPYFNIYDDDLIIFSASSVEVVEDAVSAASYTISIDPSAPAATDDVNVTIRPNIRYNDTLVNGSSSQISVTFSVGDISPKMISVNTSDDTVPEGDLTNELIRHFVSSNDSRFNNTIVNDLDVAIIDNEICVSNNSFSGTLDGSPAAPFLTVQDAISESSSIASNSANIIVASGAGVYSLSTAVSLVENVNLMGGYNDSDWSRDVIGNVTVLSDSSVSVSADVDSPQCAVSAAVGVSTSTVVDGFTINGSTASGVNFTSAVNCNGGSPTISNCVLNGGSGSSASFGVFINNCSPVILKNDIDGGSGGEPKGIYLSDSISSAHIFNNYIINDASGDTVGIHIQCTGGIQKIFNNIIVGGSSISDNTSGIFCDNSSVVDIYNNTINGGNPPAGFMSIAISLNNTNTAQIRIANNIIFTEGGDLRYGIFASNFADPQFVNNNNFFDCPSALYRDASPDSDHMSISDMKTALNGEGILANDNTDDNPQLNSSDYDFTALSPVSVTQGGLNGVDENWTDFPVNSSGNPVDYADGIRPDPPANWSMGAFQQ